MLQGVGTAILLKSNKCLNRFANNVFRTVNRGGARSNLDFALQLHYNPDRLHKPKLRRSKDGILANTNVDEMDKYIKTKKK